FLRQRHSLSPNFEVPSISSERCHSYSLSALVFLSFLMIPCPPRSTLFPYTTLFRSSRARRPGFFNSMIPIQPISPSAFSWIGIIDRKSTRLNSSHQIISYAVFCLKKKKEPCTQPSRVTHNISKREAADKRASLGDHI